MDARMRAHNAGSSSRGLRRRQAFANVRDVNVSPVLALAGLAVVGLLATRLPRPRWRHVASLDVLLAAGGPLVLLGLALGPGIDLLDRPALRSIAPVTALAIGWLGAGLRPAVGLGHLGPLPPRPLPPPPLRATPTPAPPPPPPPA